MEISNLQYNIMVDICIEGNEFGCSDIMAAIYDSGMTHEHYHGGISLA